MRACGRAKRLPFAPAVEQHGGRRRGLPDADRLHVGLDVLHRVVDREQPRDLAAGRVDVDRDVLVGVFALEVQQLGDHQVRHRVVDRRAQEDDALLQEPRVDVERPLAAVRLLDDRGDEVVADRLDLALLTPLSHLDAGPRMVLGWFGTAASSGSVRSSGLPGFVDDRRRGRPGTAAPSLWRCQSVPPPGAPAFEIAPHLRGLFLHAFGQAGDLGVELLVGRRRCLPGPRRPAARGRRAPPRSAPSRTCCDERLLLLPGRGEVLLRSSTPCASSRCVEVVEASLHLLLHERVGQLDVDELGSRVEHLVARGHLRLHLGDELEALADVGAQLVDGVELAHLRDPLVGDVGQHLALGLLDQDLERDLLARRARRSARAACR